MSVQENKGERRHITQRRKVRGIMNCELKRQKIDIQATMYDAEERKKEQ